MNPDVVVDVGNSRVKWGLCRDDRVAEVVSLSGNPTDWQEQQDRWQLTGQHRWVLSGVQPQHCRELADWLTQHGQTVLLLHSPDQLPLTTNLAQPEKAGIDRLLNAVAANRRRHAEHAALIVDAGSAITVDVVNESGTFCGGAILPGLRLMAQSLHDYTALLPLVKIDDKPSPLGTDTITAMKVGIYWSAVGAVEKLLHLQKATGKVDVFLTGGDAPLLATGLDHPVTLWPEMTLEGVRLSARNLFHNNETNHVR